MKKYRVYMFFFLIAAATAILFSCSEEDALGLESNALELQSPYGRWKLEGYVTTANKQIFLVLGDRDSYCLTLNKDGTFTGTSSRNAIGGKFTVDTHRGVINFSATDFYSSNKLNETADGSLYLARLLKVKNYRVFTDKLHLYYSDSEYMVFVKPVNR